METSVPGRLRKAELATVRQFEAAGFRAWPASAVHYDGTWVVRLTAGHPAKRLNSVNPLDPNDVHDLKDRIIRAGRRFEAYGRPLTFRLSPLAGTALLRHLADEGWSEFGHSLVNLLLVTHPGGVQLVHRDPARHGHVGRRLTLHQCGRDGDHGVSSSGRASA